MKLLWLLALLVTIQARAGCTTWVTNPCVVKPSSQSAIDLFRQIAGEKTEVVEVLAPTTPSPFMTGYDAATRTCTLLVNRAVDLPTEPMLTAALAHEAGHCYALRNSIQNINDGTTLLGEAFGDVFSMAWISKNRPEMLDDAYAAVIQHRAIDRMLDRAYNTLFVMRRARAALPSPADPFPFTIKMLQQ